MASGDVVIEHPNRDKVESQTTRAIVVGLLLASAALVAIVTLGGWSALQGQGATRIVGIVVYVIVYAVIALYIARWRSGLLPVAAALAIVLIILAAIAGPEWFSRDTTGFTEPTIDASILGLLTLLLVPLQILLIIFAAQGFRQRWSVEVERRAGTAPSSAQPV